MAYIAILDGARQTVLRTARALKHLEGSLMEAHREQGKGADRRVLDWHLSIHMSRLDLEEVAEDMLRGAPELRKAIEGFRQKTGQDWDAEPPK